jgi:hypothetical protein
MKLKQPYNMQEIKLPIYIKADINYSEILEKCKTAKNANGELFPIESIGNFEIHKNGKLMFKHLDSNLELFINPRIWNEVKAKDPSSGFYYKIDLNEDSNRLEGNTRKLHVAEETTTNLDITDSVDDIIDKIQEVQLKDVQYDPRLFVPIKTGKYLDKFWSRSIGILPGTNVMITGDPGIGKSSNMMDILIGIHETDISKRVLYISAEMNRNDMREFLQFYPGLDQINFLFLGEYLTDPNSEFKPFQALLASLEKGWDIVVLDSLFEIQSVIQEDLDINSFKRGEKWMLDLMNKHNAGFNRLNLYTSFLVIQQKNKSGQYVGSKRLEHMTTAFLQLLWDPKEHGKRYMVFEKNRKGKEKVKLYYTMDEKKGVVYDEVRHTKELEFMQILAENTGLGIDQMDETYFERLFNDQLVNQNEQA